MASETDAVVAFTYAWWLTGDEHAALAALRAAGRANRPGGREDRRLVALLRAVRAAAAPQQTMCPASEVALLHDAHGVSIDEAARLAAVDPADARTELAHGRLEALVETVIDPFEHPERLGGLAVGNPADVAHARQCASCEQTRELLERGRVELRELAAVAVPTAVDGLVGGDPTPRTSVGAVVALLGVGILITVVVVLLTANAG